jgi:hypothetical protein
MRNSMFGILILMLAVVAGTTTAQAQTSVTVGLSNSGVINSSKGNRATPSNAATLNFVADSSSAKSVVAARAGNYTFEFTRGPVITAPEPTTMLLFGSGLLLVAGVLRRRRRSKAKQLGS